MSETRKLAAIMAVDVVGDELVGGEAIKGLQSPGESKGQGKYRGRPEDTDRLNGIVAMLKGGATWTDVQLATGCSRSTISRAMRRVALKAAA